MTRPIFPLICISDGGGLDLIPDEKWLSRVSTLALIDPAYYNSFFCFDKDNQKWSYRQVADSFKNTWLTRVLAKTFYNPSHNARVIWELNGPYEINELKNQLNNCVDKDDDIITQFEEADIIKSAINTCSSFDEIIQVLNKYVFAVDEKELWKEQDERDK